MLISSDLMVLGTRYYHESGVPYCGTLHQRKTFVVQSSIQGLSTVQQARSPGFKKGFSVGRAEVGNNMQRVVSRHTALKFNQFLLVGLQPVTNSAAQSSHGWRRSLGFSRSFALHPMDYSVRSLIGNARVLGSLPGHSGWSSIKVGSSVPCDRPTTTRRSFRESKKLVTRRSRQRSTSSRIGSSGDFSPQRMLECAVDVLRNFNEKVNNFFQQDSESGSRDFATAAEEKFLTSADSAVGENVTSESVDGVSEQPAGSGFEWRSALWEAEVLSVEEGESASQSGLVRLGTHGDTSQLSASNSPESALGKGDVEVRTGGAIEETKPEVIPESAELQIPENGNVLNTVPVADDVSAVGIENVGIENVEISQVEESTTYSRSDLVSTGTDGDIFKVGSSHVPEALGDADVQFRGENKIEEAFKETITAYGELEHSQIEKLVGKDQESGVSCEEMEDVEVSSVVSRSSDLFGSGPDGHTSQLSGSVVVVSEAAVSESKVEIRAEEKIKEAATEVNSVTRELEHLGNVDGFRTVSAGDPASYGRLDLAEISSAEESGAGSRSLGSDGNMSQSSPDAPGHGVAEAEFAVRAMTEEIVPGRELEHSEDGDVVRISQDSEEASSSEIKEVDIGELWNRRTLGPSSLSGLEPSISRELRPWGFGEDSGSVQDETRQRSTGERERSLEVESGDTKSPSEELLEQNARSEPLFGSSFPSVEAEAVQSSAPEIDRAHSKLELNEQGYPRFDFEPPSILGKEVQNTFTNVQAETLERSTSQTQDGIDTKLYLADELAEQTPNSEPSNGSGAFVEQSGESSDTIEKEKFLQKRSPIGGLLERDESATRVSAGSGEAGESSTFGGQTCAREASIMEVKPVSPDEGLLSEEFGEPKREWDTVDAEVASEKQIQADRRPGSDSYEDHLDVQSEITRLRSSISHHAYLYHTLGTPVISDAAYDSLVKEIVHLESQESKSEPKLNFLAAAQPSLDVLKVVHSVPMLSLASVQKEEEAYLWYQKLRLKLGLDYGPLRWVVEPKVDGLALSLRYEHGKLKWAATRGNGVQGEDVTHNAPRVLGIPLTIPDKLPGTESPLTVLEVRGEVYMSVKDFEESNASKIQAGEKPMANPRNAAAGSMRLLSSNAGECRPLNFMAYSIAVMEVESELPEDVLETSSLVPKTQWEVLRLLESVGFPVNEANGLFESFESALEYANIWRSTRESLEYEADGVVLKVDDLETQAWLGVAGADPRWALAWKFAATEAVSVLEGIELTIGRSGAMIPNARFKPVELGGVTISRASLHNFGHVRALGLCEGDHIVVQRAGDVIPHVVQVMEDLRPETAKPWSPPTECPTCGSKLTEISASAMVFCSNSTCESRHSRQVAHFAKTLISGLGSATLSRLEEELVKDPADFYNLDEKALLKVKGFGKQSTKRLLKAIEESKQQDLSLFIAALGIPRVGNNTAKELAERFGSLQALLKSDLSGFKDVPGIGAATASCIFDWCQSEPNIELVRRLEIAGCKINGNQVIETHEKLDSEDHVLINGQSPTIAAGTTNESEGKPDVVEGFEEVIETYESGETPDVLKKTDGSPVDVTLPPPTPALSPTIAAGTTNESEGKPEVVEGFEEVIETYESGETRDVLKKTDESPVGVTAPTTPVLSGKSIVITGDFGTMSREHMKKLVTLHGGVVRTSVTSKTSFLLCGNRPGPSKITEASRRGVEMLDFKSFLRLIGRTESDVVN